MDQQARFQLVTSMFTDMMPYNEVLQLSVREIGADRVEVFFPFSPKLVGNPYHNILHGGVTSAVLDHVGGLMVAANLVADLEAKSEKEVMQRLSNLGTIDLRTDYLRPGKGEHFIASARLIRSGNKVAVSRMEMHNQDGTHIAFGTATYLVG